MLKSLTTLVERGPIQGLAPYFTVLRAMSFCVDEFHERQHHPKESELLFPKLVAASPEVADAVRQLDADHVRGEAAVREMQRLLTAWEMTSESQRRALEDACTAYVKLYRDHMQLEESVILAAAERSLSSADWQRIDEGFALRRGPLAGNYEHDPDHVRLVENIHSMSLLVTKPNAAQRKP